MTLLIMGGGLGARFYDRLGEPGMLKRLAARASVVVVYASRMFGKRVA